MIGPQRIAHSKFLLSGNPRCLQDYAPVNPHPAEAFETTTHDATQLTTVLPGQSTQDSARSLNLLHADREKAKRSRDCIVILAVQLHTGLP